MRRKNLFFIALVSAIITFISLNIAIGRPGYNYYDQYPYYHRYHHYYDRHYNERYERDHQPSDSTNSNY